MAWHEDILADLPAPHDAEPPSLRQEIADELADHLQSAALRETLLQTQPEEVEKRILMRFGNPKKIARQLWFDAMKEKLMLQKLTLALVTLAAIASATACGLMLTFGMKANEELLEQNRQMMEQLTTLAHREPEGPSLMEWVPLSVQLKQPNEKHAPAAGFQIQLAGYAISTTEKANLKEQTDQTGLAKFGPVRPGTYKMSIDAPWGQKLEKSIVIKPGEAHTETIKCPADPPKSEQVKPVVKWTKELKDQDVAALVKVSVTCETTIDENTWKENEEYYLLIRPDGRLAKYVDGVERHTHTQQLTRSKHMVWQGIALYFRSMPEVFQDSFPVMGQFLVFHELQLLRLPRDADFPANGDSLCTVPVEQYLGLYNPIRRKLGSQSRVQLTNPGGSQEVSIELDPAAVVMAQARLAIEEFPQFGEVNVVRTALAFFRDDKDQNMELSEEELKSDTEEVRQKFDQFPVSFKTYIHKTLEDMADQPKKKP